MKTFAAVLVLVSGLASSAAAEPCYDLARGQPSELSGELAHRIMPGPPEYQDVQKGDQPTPTWFLLLDAQICIEDGEFANPGHRFHVVHVVPNVEGLLDDYRGRRVTLAVSDRWAAHTVHHRAPLVAVVDSVAVQRDATEEYGTSATVVRGFYLALGNGDGDEAARFVVPEKREKGPLSAESLSGFYGGMEQPLELIDLEPLSGTSYLASYRFRKGSRSCAGRAEVMTVERNGRSYVERIKALDGC